MVYHMLFRVDGGCRRNGQPNAIGSAACCRYFNFRGVAKRPRSRVEVLPALPTPTNQRAEITAIILALKWALDRYGELEHPRPKLSVTIIADSDYAVNCLTKWIRKWLRNGWRTTNGRDVQNRDLIEEALWLEGRLKELGKLRYKWAPREKNRDADRRCNGAMDKQEQH